MTGSNKSLAKKEEIQQPSTWMEELILKTPKCPEGIAVSDFLNITAQVRNNIKKVIAGFAIIPDISAILYDYQFNIIIGLLKTNITPYSFRAYLDGIQMSNMMRNKIAELTFPSHATLLHKLTAIIDPKYLQTVFAATYDLINPNEANDTGITVLMIAVQRRDFLTVARLCATNFPIKLEINARDNKGRTALHYACAVGDLEVVQCLVTYDADIQTLDKDGVSPSEMTNCSDDTLAQIVSEHSIFDDHLLKLCRAERAAIIDFLKQQSTALNSKVEVSEKKPLNIALISNEAWNGYRNNNLITRWCIDYDSGKLYPYDPYKLHISISPNRYLELMSQINKILYKAIENHIIQHFKCLKVISAEGNRDEMHMRAENMPYCLYLFHNYERANTDAVVALCLEIENLLKINNVPVGDKTHFSKSDLFLSEHIVFRVVTLDPLQPEYIASNSGRAILLEEAGMKSQYYQHIKAALQKHVESTAPMQPNTGIVKNVYALSSHVASGKSPVSVRKQDEKMMDDGYVSELELSF